MSMNTAGRGPSASARGRCLGEKVLAARSASELWDAFFREKGVDVLVQAGDDVEISRGRDLKSFLLGLWRLDLLFDRLYYSFNWWLCLVDLAGYFRNRHCHRIPWFMEY